MKLFKKKDKNIEAEENLAKNAESAKTAADGKNAGAAQDAKEDVPETIVCPKCGKTVLKSVVKQHKYVCYGVIIISVYVLKIESEWFPTRKHLSHGLQSLQQEILLISLSMRRKLQRLRRKQDFLRALSSVRQRFTARRQCLV